MNFEVIISMFSCVVGLVGLYKIFEKMGEPGWKGIVPFYNIYLLFDKLLDKTYGIGYICATLVTAVCTVFLETNSQGNTFLMIVSAISSLILFALSVMLMIRLGKAFGKSNAFIAGLILLTSIFELILGTDDSVYDPGQKDIQI